MKHRQFLTAYFGTSALVHAHEPFSAQATPASDREVFLLRRYDLRIGPESKMTENCFSATRIPALDRIRLDFRHTSTK